MDMFLLINTMQSKLGLSPTPSESPQSEIDCKKTIERWS